MKRTLITALIVFGAALASPLPSSAGSAPAWHFGSFAKQASAKHCVRFAKEALARQNCKVLSEGTYTVLGGNDQVIVEVACAPLANGTTEVVVTAFSTNSQAAEAARNAVREYIVKVVIID